MTLKPSANFLVQKFGGGGLRNQKPLGPSFGNRNMKIIGR